MTCRHFILELIEEGELHTCDAFPKGIPEDIYNEDKEHDKPVEGQVDDFVYTSYQIIS